MRDRRIQEHEEQQEQILNSASIDADALEMEARIANNESSRLKDQLNAMQLAFTANKETSALRTEGTAPSSMLNFDSILSSMGDSALGGAKSLGEFMDMPSSDEEAAR